MSNQASNQNCSKEASRCGVRFPDRWAWILFAGFSIGGAGLDLWSKKAVFEWLGPPGSGHTYSIIPGFFQLLPCLNSGAAFSIFQGQRTVLSGISIAALIAVLILFLTGQFRRRIMQIAIGCITAGIIGNLYDRLFNEGLVRDFLDFHIGAYSWPTFNAADSLLCIGVGLILIANFISEGDQKQDLPKKTE